MFVKVDDVIINDEYIGYAYVFKRDENKGYKWILYIRFANENQYGDYLELKYETEKEAMDELKKLENKLLRD